MPIEKERERLIIARLLLNLCRAYAGGYYPHLGLARSMDLIAVATVVFTGHVDGRPSTLATVARAIDLPHATALRKLRQLIRLGYIVKRGRHYCLNVAQVGSGKMVEVAEQNEHSIMQAAEELFNLKRNRIKASILDRNPTKSDT